MLLKASSIRYAHIDGFTYCAFTEDGSLIITCGYDGDIRTWQGIDDDDPTSKCLGEFINCVVQYDKRLLACTDLNCVNAYTYPALERDGAEFRFTAPATCVKVNKKYIAAGSEGTEIKVLIRDNKEEFELKGHEGPILNIDLSKKYLLASSSGDGTIKIWNLLDKKEIKTITGFPKATTFESANFFITPSFEPKTGDYLAYCCGNEIIVLNCTTWDIKTKLKHNDVINYYNSCSFSPCGQFIAAASKEGELVVFDFLHNKAISDYIYNNELLNVTTIAWNPKNNYEFAYCDSAGHLGTVILENSNIVNSNHVDGNFLAPEADEDDNNFDGIQFRDDNNDNYGDYNDGGSDETCVSLEKLEKDYDNDRKSVYSDTRDGSFEKGFAKNYIQQNPFQPGATPEEAEHRYLVWNNVGIVRAHKDDGGDGSIDVEFHDVNLHHALHMNNYMNHTMASLSSTVIALSSYNSSKLVCITLGAAGSREWSIELPDCEGIMAITATTKFVAVATDNRFVRIFSVMGTQREVISIPGPVIAMSGYEDRLMITYHSAPATEDQHISAMLLQAFGLTLRCREIRVPITPGKKLTWIGYSDKGSPICYDTMGILKMYSMKTNCWYPVCDTMKHAGSISNNFYIIHVSESTQVVQAILCRGCSYPVTTPRPIVTELPMQIPLCEIETDKSMLEETLIRWSNFSVDDSDRMIKESAIKLFALACRTEMEARAKELIEMIASPHLLSLAVKYASKLGRIHLADKLSELLPQLEEQEKEREQQMKEADMEVINLIQNSSLSESLMLLQKNKTSATQPQTPVPSIAPKPMLLSSNKNNPFKKMASGTSTPLNKTSNPLSHLAEKIIGHDTKNSQMEGINELQEQSQQIEQNDQISSTNTNYLNPSTSYSQSLSETFNKENDEIPSSLADDNNQNNKNSSNRENFITWFSKNKQKLKEKHLNIDDKELAKIALKEFRQMVNEEKESKNIGKRKLEENSEEKQSGIAKLAKFGFKN